MFLLGSFDAVVLLKLALCYEFIVGETELRIESAGVSFVTSMNFDQRIVVS